MITKKTACLLMALAVLALSGCNGSAPASPEDSSTNGIHLEVDSSRHEVSSASETSGDLNDPNSTPDSSTAENDPTTSKGSDDNSGANLGNPGGSSVGIGGGSSIGTPVGGQISSPGNKPPTNPTKAPEKPVEPSKPASTNPSKPPKPSEPSVPDDLKPYVYPFDVVKIKADLIRYGESLGMIHRTHHPDGKLRTPDNCSWWYPYPLSADCNPPEVVRKQLYERVAFDMEDLNLKDFTIFIEGNNGTYNVYMMH